MGTAHRYQPASKSQAARVLRRSWDSWSTCATGGFISAHDFHIAREIATVVCGGDVDPNTEVSEAYIMTLERRAFGRLLASEKSQARIMGMLNTGKPLRN